MNYHIWYELGNKQYELMVHLKDADIPRLMEIIRSIIPSGATVLMHAPLNNLSEVTQL